MRLHLLLVAMLGMSAMFGEEVINLGIYKANADQAFAASHGNPQLLIQAAGLYMDSREYRKAEDIYTDLVARYRPNAPFFYSNLSVFCGKQRKFETAITYADLALAMDPDNMHAKAVKASWLYESGKTASGLALFESIRVPLDESGRELYYGCRACFYASVGDAKQVMDAMKSAKSDEAKVFFRNDVVFDKFRYEEWYVEIHGTTKVVAN